MANKTYTFDKATEMKDAGAVTASAGAQVGGSAKILDLGAGLMEGTAVLDVTALDVASADEKYEIEWQLSNDAAFATGIVVAAVVKLGATAATGGSAATVIGRVAQLVANEFQGTIYRYARLFHRIGGTTPSINYKAFLAQAVTNT